MPDTPSPSRSRPAHGRRELAMLSLRLHARTIAWVAGISILTLAMAAVGILQTLKVGEPIVRAGTVVEVPSSQSIHVRVRLDTGDAVLVPREAHVWLAEGDPVTVVETVSALSRVGYRLSDADAGQ